MFLQKLPITFSEPNSMKIFKKNATEKYTHSPMIKIKKVELNKLKISKIVILLIYYLCSWHVTIAATAITTSTIPPQAKPIIAPVLSPSSLVSVLPTSQFFG